MTSGARASKTSDSRGRVVRRAEREPHERPLRRVGKYRILSELGRGGMANVFLAVSQGSGGVNKLVVLKALLSELSSQPDALAMFLDEARLAARLNHPNVVQTYEIGTEGDRHVIVMEYLEGQSFSQVLKRGEATGKPVSLAMQLRVISAVLEGLHYAHELSDYGGVSLGLVHRDVSPQNVFVTYDGQVKVLDFGIAKATSSSTHTATGIIKGKMAYMAPEQMIGDPVDRRADLYSVGCMLWAATAGVRLWKDAADVHIMRQVINGETPSPRTVNPSCDDELQRIVMRSLASSPAERYSTALELQADIDRYAESFSSPVKPKEIGGLVSTLFADTRAELKALVDRQLALVAESTTADELSLPRVQGPLEQPLAIESIPPDGAPTVIPEPPRSKLALPIILVALAGLALGAFAFTRTSADAAAPPTSASAAPAGPEITTVQISARPENAQLFLDDRRLPNNPASIPVPLDGSPRLLRVVADGYLTNESTFVATRDRRIEIALRPVPAPPSTPSPADSAKPSRPGKGVGVKPRLPTGTPVKSTPSCAQPFVIDSDGIRKMRPECM